MNTIWIYVDTRYQVGYPDHIKAFVDPEAADEWFNANDPEGAPSNMRCLSKTPVPVLLIAQTCRRRVL